MIMIVNHFILDIQVYSNSILDSRKDILYWHISCHVVVIPFPMLPRTRKTLIHVLNFGETVRVIKRFGSNHAAQSRSTITQHNHAAQSRSSHAAQSRSTGAQRSRAAQSRSAVTQRSHEAQSRSTITQRSDDAQSRSDDAQSRSAVTKHNHAAQSRSTITQHNHAAQSRSAIMQHMLHNMHEKVPRTQI